MKEVVFEVVIAVLIMALLVVVINLFRGNLDIIGSTAEKSDKLDKVQSESLGIDMSKSSVKGSDVVSAIRYYINKPEVKILVDQQNYSGKTNLSDIKYEANYTAKYIFGQASKNIEEIDYSLMSDLSN
ncbi:MAG: hypothetical protein Q8942_20730 [Bacillota bacterium]|nr:hypothetical protein [Bacillota bacterium]